MIVDRMDSKLELISIQWATVLVVFVAFCILIINNAGIAQAAPGDLDSSFDTDGIVTTAISTDSNDEARAAVIQPDGKIVVAGHVEINGQSDIAVVRYNADGSPDTTFSGGIVTTDISGGDDEAYGVAIQGDSKIVVVGRTQSTGPFDIAVVRYKPDGNLDDSFSGGIVTTDISGGDDEAYGVAIQGNGKIVVAGRTQSAGLFDVAVARYNADGSPDNSFGNNSVVTTQISSGNDEARAVALQSDGKIVVAGRTQQGTFDIALVRYDSNGAVDTDFGTNGVVTTFIGSGDDEAEAIAIQPDGKIVVAGRTQQGTSDIALVRYNANGSLDNSFSGGIVTTDIGGSDDEAYGVAIQSDGKIVVAGWSEQNGTHDIALARYEATSSGGSSGGNTSGRGSGGGCTMNPRGGFDVTLVSLLGLILVYFGWKVFKRYQIK